MTPGFGHEFLQRQDGYAGLVAAYGLRFGAQPRGMELSLIYRALADGQVDVIAGDATSALIPSLDLVHLEDTRRYFPPYDAIPLARTASLLREPAIGRRCRDWRAASRRREHARAERRGGRGASERARRGGGVPGAGTIAVKTEKTKT
jgi:hypothetical protein